MHVVAWLGPLAGGELALKAVYSLYEEYRRQEDLRRATLSAGQELEPRSDEDTLSNMSDGLMRELEFEGQTRDNEILAKFAALDNCSVRISDRAFGYGKNWSFPNLLSFTEMPSPWIQNPSSALLESC